MSNSVRAALAQTDNKREKREQSPSHKGAKQAVRVVCSQDKWQVMKQAVQRVLLIPIPSFCVCAHLKRAKVNT